MPPQVLAIGPASDGTNAGPQSSKGMVQNDGYFLDKIAERWIKDRNEAQPGITYILDRLPAGYRGFERQRENTKHIDRYFYGHPKGIFRSINELYPHFKQLQETGSALGCPCKLCSGAKTAGGGRKSLSGSVTSSGSAQKPKAAKSKIKPVPTFAPTLKSRPSNFETLADGLPQGRLPSDSPSLGRRKQVDEEGSPDIYRKLIDKLQAAGEGGIDVPVVDSMSPDWRAGHQMLQYLFEQWEDQPQYIPRLGEVVLFTRSSNDGAIVWDGPTASFRRLDLESGAVLESPRWEAGVVTQMPITKLTDEDLLFDNDQKQNVSYSGFRVEPMSKPSSDYKPFTSQHKYVPLHAIRPLSYWKDCVGELEDAHPSITHALTVCSSFCVLGKYSFKGTWPEATLFSSAAYIGAELILLGDIVKLAPFEHKSHATDVLLITSIRTRFIDLDRASDDDYDRGTPYTTVLHVAGKAFTLDPKRSYAGIAKTPAIPGQDGLPEGLAVFGQWFHMIDPARPKHRLEVPFRRVLGRCHVDKAIRAWSASPADLKAPSAQGKSKNRDLSHGLAAVDEARAYSMKHDIRIDREAGKNWFWADTRIEQLDLHEVNGRFVGEKDTERRTMKQVRAWQQALKVLDGKRGGLEEYHAARQKLEEEENQTAAQTSGWGMMAAPAQVDSGTDMDKAEEDMEAQEGADDDAMDVEESDGDMGIEAALQQQIGNEIINMIDESDDEEDGQSESGDQSMPD